MIESKSTEKSEKKSKKNLKGYNKVLMRCKWGACGFISGANEVY